MELSDLKQGRGNSQVNRGGRAAGLVTEPTAVGSAQTQNWDQEPKTNTQDADQVTLGPKAQAIREATADARSTPTGSDSAADSTSAVDAAATSAGAKSTSADKARGDARAKIAGELSEAEKKRVEELKKRDQEVKQHEQAHLAALGRFRRGGAQYEYTTGPDRQRYATAGEVPVDLSPVKGDPEATVEKAETIKRAAIAPVEPSSADRSVYAAASQMEAAAQVQLMKQRTEKNRPEQGGSPDQAAEAVSGQRSAPEKSKTPAATDPRSSAAPSETSVKAGGPRGDKSDAESAPNSVQRRAVNTQAAAAASLGRISTFA